MNTKLQLLDTYVEQVLLGVIYLFTGYFFLVTFNDHFIGILGFAGMLFGGFKMAIGILVYAFWGYALLIRPQDFVRVQTRKPITKVLKRVEADLIRANREKAIQRILCLLNVYPSDHMLHRKAAWLYARSGNAAQAGRYLFLLDARTAEEQQLVDSFAASLGNDPFHILRTVVKELHLWQADPAYLSKLKPLVEAIHRDHEKQSHVSRSVLYLVQRAERPIWQKLKEERKGIMIETGIVVLAIVLIFLKYRWQ